MSLIIMMIETGVGLEGVWRWKTTVYTASMHEEVVQRLKRGSRLSHHKLVYSILSLTSVIMAFKEKRTITGKSSMGT